MLGVDKETEARYQNRRAWEYDVLHQGFRYHLGAIPASIGLSQLALLDEFVCNRQDYCRGYNQRLDGIPEVITPDSDYKDFSVPTSSPITRTRAAAICRSSTGSRARSSPCPLWSYMDDAVLDHVAAGISEFFG